MKRATAMCNCSIMIINDTLTATKRSILIVSVCSSSARASVPAIFDSIHRLNTVNSCADNRAGCRLFVAQCCRSCKALQLFLQGLADELATLRKEAATPFSADRETQADLPTYCSWILKRKRMQHTVICVRV